MLASCMSSPETVVRDVDVARGRLPSIEAIAGPMGVNVSKLLPSVNWRSGVSSWARRPETSWTTEMPPIASRAFSGVAR